MKHYRILILAALAAASASCAVKEDGLSSSRAIRFTTNLGAYATKATDTNFEQGDAVSLFAESPINELNVKMTYDGGNLVPEKSIFWPENMQEGQYVNFFAVYPYRTDWEDGSDLSVFSVNADQRTHELYTASDLLGASYMALPDCETVPLNFTHRLSKVECHVYGLENEVVTDVYLADVYGKVRLNLWSRMDVYYVGDKGTVRMGKVENPWSDENNYVAIVPPQDMSFKILVVTESGNQYTFARSRYSDLTYMESARKYGLYLDLREAAPSMEFDVKVSEWTADNDLQFGNYIADEYQNEGSWYLVRTDENGADVNTLMQYHAYDYASVETGIEAGDNAQYRIVYQNGRRVRNYGLEKSELVPGQYTLVENGQPFSWSGNVPVELSYDLYNKVLNVREDTDVWSVIGSFDNWQEDMDMTRVSHGVYTIDIEYWNEEFKFRCNHAWDPLNIGNYDDDVFYASDVATWYTAAYGSNIRIDTPGIYRLTLNVVTQRLSITFLGELSDDTFDSMLGTWNYADESLDISINPDGGNFIINYYGWPIKAEFRRSTGSFDVKFQNLEEVYWGNYGLCYDWFRGFYSIPDDDGEYWLWGNMSDLILFSGSIAADGSLDIEPGLSYDGYPFYGFDIVRAIQEGTNAGYYGRYFSSLLPLPQTWTRVNE